jgi:nucleotide-binding universal stress UspA family protein
MSRPIRSIVAGIADAGEDAHLADAVRLADRLGAVLHVVHAYHLPDPALYPHVELAVFRPGALQDVHERVQGLLEEQVRKLSPGAGVTCRAVPVPPAMAILEAAYTAGADLITVGATRHGAVARTLLGTTAQRVLRGSPVPVLVSRHAGDVRRRVLLTADLSDLSVKVHRRAVDLATVLAGTEAELRSLLVVSYDVPLLVPVEPGGLADAGRQELAAFLDRAGSGAARLEQKVRVGEAAHEILAEVEEWGADLLVLGTHGRSGVSRFLIGSVAESVLNKVDCEVLVIPSSAVSAAAMNG